MLGQVEMFLTFALDTFYWLQVCLAIFVRINRLIFSHCIEVGYFIIGIVCLVFFDCINVCCFVTWGWGPILAGTSPYVVFWEFFGLIWNLYITDQFVIIYKITKSGRSEVQHKQTNKKFEICPKDGWERWVKYIMTK